MANLKVGRIAQWLAKLALGHSNPGFNSPMFSKYYEDKIIDLVMLIIEAGYRKVDSGLKIITEPI